MVKGSKIQKIILDSQGSYLGMEKGCFVVRDRKGNSEKYPLFEKEIGEVILKSGNMVSTGALASFGFWDIDVLIMTQRGRPVAMLKSLDDDSHVKTRISQYEALKNGKGIVIAEEIVKAKFEGQNRVLKKYGFKPIEYNFGDVKNRKNFLTVESHVSRVYFQRIFSLFSENIRPHGRKTYKAYDGVNNIFNLGYELLSWKVHKAIISAKLEPYLGFLHSEQFGKPSLVYDLMELYRFLVDDFLINCYRGIDKKSFVTKYEALSRKKIGKREYLNDGDSKSLMRRLNRYFESNIEIPRIRVGKKQTIETLINEEALLLAKFLRNEKKDWLPRIGILD